MKVPYIRHMETVAAIVKTYNSIDIQAGIDYLVSLTNGQINNIDKHDLESLGIVHYQRLGRVSFCEQEALAVLHRLMLAKKKVKVYGKLGM
jgi:hypothetical protein